MSELVRIIDEYREAHGRPSDASIARGIEVAPQVISSWRTRGVKQPPDPGTLRRLAEFMKVPYHDYVLAAVLVDVGLEDTMPTLEEARRLERVRRAG